MAGTVTPPAVYNLDGVRTGHTFLTRNTPCPRTESGLEGRTEEENHPLTRT